MGSIYMREFGLSSFSYSNSLSVRKYGEKDKNWAVGGRG